jgi:hypothetical protein
VYAKKKKKVEKKKETNFEEISRKKNFPRMEASKAEIFKGC